MMNNIGISNINFKGVYVLDGKTYTAGQNDAKKGIIEKLKSDNGHGITYAQQIKNMGYDVLVMNDSLNDEIEVGLGVIKDFESHKNYDGSYDVSDCVYIDDYEGESFSPNEFIYDIYDSTYKSTKKQKAIAALISIIMVVAAMFGAKAIVDKAIDKRNNVQIEKSAKKIGQIIKNDIKTFKLNTLA